MGWGIPGFVASLVAAVRAGCGCFVTVGIKNVVWQQQAGLIKAGISSVLQGDLCTREGGASMQLLHRMLGLVEAMRTSRFWIDL